MRINKSCSFYLNSLLGLFWQIAILEFRMCGSHFWVVSKDCYWTIREERTSPGISYEEIFYILRTVFSGTPRVGYFWFHLQFNIVETKILQKFCYAMKNFSGNACFNSNFCLFVVVFILLFCFVLNDAHIYIKSRQWLSLHTELPNIKVHC